MKRRRILFGLLAVILLEAAVPVIFLRRDNAGRQDTVAVNEIVKSVEQNWEDPAGYANDAELDYVVLDGEGRVLFRTRDNLSESLHAGIAHRDTILDIERDGRVVGKVIIYNPTDIRYTSQQQRILIMLLLLVVVQGLVLAGYSIYLDRIVVKPFQKLKTFARRVAGGNLDIPLEMDRQNLFGAFTESFDIMRFELKKARIAEAEANAAKKELVAKLSHDIKTPVASIKAASEVGFALSDSERMKDNYTQIIRKADQINSLITELFTATLKELRQLPVTPADMDSRQIKTLLENADYLHRAALPEIPACLVYGDPLRLQQVFDNIFANSYKYAGTKITVTAVKENDRLALAMEDSGGGVPAGELALLKEKFIRGSNAKEIEGAGLGLYISDYFMKEMDGELIVENGVNGLKVSVMISLSGTV